MSPGRTKHTDMKRVITPIQKIRDLLEAGAEVVVSRPVRGYWTYYIDGNPITAEQHHKMLTEYRMKRTVITQGYHVTWKMVEKK